MAKDRQDDLRQELEALKHCVAELEHGEMAQFVSGGAGRIRRGPPPFARIEDRIKSLAAGYEMHVSKPVEPGELLAIVASLSGFIDLR